MQMRRILITLSLLLLAACQLGGGAQPSDKAEQNAVLQGEVTVTALPDAPAAPPAEPPPADDPPQSQPVTPTPDTPPAPPKSAAELACRDQGGTWAHAGASPGFTCIRPTRDAGKACEKQSQCEGLCLARSGTCSPVAPLFGCNDILQNDGSRVTLCID